MDEEGYSCPWFLSAIPSAVLPCWICMMQHSIQRGSTRVRCKALLFLARNHSCTLPFPFRCRCNMPGLVHCRRGRAARWRLGCIMSLPLGLAPPGALSHKREVESGRTRTGTNPLSSHAIAFGVWMLEKVYLMTDRPRASGGSMQRLTTLIHISWLRPDENPIPGQGRRVGESPSSKPVEWRGLYLADRQPYEVKRGRIPVPSLSSHHEKSILVEFSPLVFSLAHSPPPSSPSQVRVLVG